ncbi:hypothetical protein BDV98DRAFT_658534 [Pterulicium gracile]|uniref:Uncharacterized protein n=1 Tax=Pterulicium gracile TaxID=1884261 RepID=A0A5C3Q8L3_9AGAR|nr:hypothetical protein BDV98DRAFT_658534 [Pterula gracilis]
MTIFKRWSQIDSGGEDTGETGHLRVFLGVFEEWREAQNTWARFANFNSSFLGTLDAIEAGDLAHDHGDFGKLGEGMHAKEERESQQTSRNTKNAAHKANMLNRTKRASEPSRQINDPARRTPKGVIWEHTGFGILMSINRQQDTILQVRDALDVEMSKNVGYELERQVQVDTQVEALNHTSATVPSVKEYARI